MAVVKLVKHDRLAGGIDNRKSIIKDSTVNLPIGSSKSFQMFLNDQEHATLFLSGIGGNSSSIINVQVTNNGDTLLDVNVKPELFEQKLEFFVDKGEATYILTFKNIGIVDTSISKFVAMVGQYNDEVITFTPKVAKESKFADLGGWHIDFEVPTEYSEDFKDGHIVLAKTKSKGQQPFRVRNIVKTKRGIKFTAYHVFFDTMNYIIKQLHLVNATPAMALSEALESVDREHPFKSFSSVDSDITEDVFAMPLYDFISKIVEDTRCKVDIDGWEIKLVNELGKDTGNVVAYAKNLSGFDYTENFDKVTTKLFPYAIVKDETYTLPEQYVYSEVSYTTEFAKAMEFKMPDEVIIKEDGKDEAIDYSLIEETLRVSAQTYLAASQYPALSFKISTNLSNDFDIWDTVHFKHPSMTYDLPLTGEISSNDLSRVSIPVRVSSYEYDVLSGRLLSLGYGEKFSGIKSVLGEVVDRVEKEIQPKLDSLEQKRKEQADIIENLNKNGHVIIYENEILAVDTLPPESATNVLKLGAGGLLTSTSGVDGPYELAIGIDGVINANKILAGEIEGSLIKAESIMANSLSLDAIEFIMSFTKASGNNMARNSVMMGGTTKHWSRYASTTVTPVTTSWVLRGQSKYGFSMSGTGILGVYQRINNVGNQRISFTSKVLKPSGGTLLIDIRSLPNTDNTEDSVLVAEKIIESGTPFDGYITIGGVPDHKDIYIRFRYTDALAENPMYVTDVMVGIGDTTVWSPAVDEIYGADVNIDSDGVEVRRRHPETGEIIGYTIMTPQEFAGYYGSEKVFTLNEDITEVMGLEVKEKGLFISPIKIVQNKAGKSADIVWTG